MDRSVLADYPPPLTPPEENHLVSLVKDWAARHGLAVKPPQTFIPRESDPQGVLTTNAPVTLFPSPFPRSCFDTAVSVQRVYNELYAAISRNETWLGRVIEE